MSTSPPEAYTVLYGGTADPVNGTLRIVSANGLALPSKISIEKAENGYHVLRVNNAKVPLTINLCRHQKNSPCDADDAGSRAIHHPSLTYGYQITLHSDFLENFGFQWTPVPDENAVELMLEVEHRQAVFNTSAAFPNHPVAKLTQLTPTDTCLQFKLELKRLKHEVLETREVLNVVLSAYRRIFRQSYTLDIDEVQGLMTGKNSHSVPKFPTTFKFRRAHECDTSGQLAQTHLLELDEKTAHFDLLGMLNLPGRKLELLWDKSILLFPNDTDGFPGFWVQTADCPATVDVLTWTDSQLWLKRVTLDPDGTNGPIVAEYNVAHLTRDSHLVTGAGPSATLTFDGIALTDTHVIGAIISVGRGILDEEYL
ncbi:hypothetical protein C8R47DRAFT_1212077 [Mycena vitilis]|nr:hypothetical protein C8R47DRAFT_1212077 [Mycena vitilis]